MPQALPFSLLSLKNLFWLIWQCSGEKSNGSPEPQVWLFSLFLEKKKNVASILLLLIGGPFWSLQVKPPRIIGGQSKKIKKLYKLLIGGSFWSIQVKSPRIIGGQSKKIKKLYKFSQKLEISSHQFGKSNYNSHWICNLFLINYPPMLLWK